MGEADGVRPVLSFQAYAGAGRVGGSALSDQVPVQHIGGIELKTRHGGEDPKLPAAVRGPENRRRSQGTETVRNDKAAVISLHGGGMGPVHVQDVPANPLWRPEVVGCPRRIDQAVVCGVVLAVDGKAIRKYLKLAGPEPQVEPGGAAVEMGMSPAVAAGQGIGFPV